MVGAAGKSRGHKKEKEYKTLLKENQYTENKGEKKVEMICTI